MTAWDDVIADLERRRDHITRTIEVVKAVRSLAERMQPPISEIDFSRAPVLRELLGISGDETMTAPEDEQSPLPHEPT